MLFRSLQARWSSNLASKERQSRHKSGAMKCNGRTQSMVMCRNRAYINRFSPCGDSPFVLPWHAGRDELSVCMTWVEARLQEVSEWNRMCILAIRTHMPYVLAAGVLQAAGKLAQLRRQSGDMHGLVQLLQHAMPFFNGQEA